MTKITGLILSVTLLGGCTTSYRWDVADCAAVGLFDAPPRGCWCEDYDTACLRLEAAHGRYAEAYRGYYQHSYLDGGVHRPGPPHPSAALTAYASGMPWTALPPPASPWRDGDPGAGERYRASVGRDIE